MSTSSKYIQLSSSVLMEYVYSDQSQVNVPGNQFRISTAVAPIWKMSNQYTKIDQILNSDYSENIINGSPQGTGNVRNRSFAQIETYKSALLDINKVVPFNDYDSNLTPSAQLPISFSSVQAPVYDTIRLHLVQGFNFELNKGLSLSIKIKRKDGKSLFLCNFVYNRTDSFETLNPSPFFFGGRVYDTYVEIRVLSLYNLEYDYWLGTLTGDTVVEKITDGLGVQRDQQIQVYFSWIRDYITIDEQDYLFTQDTVAIDLPTRDQFETISAYIDESTGGDYVEFYAKYNSVIIEQFINDLNNSGFDFILLHDLTVSEYVSDPSVGGYNWIKTDELQISQVDNYDLPNVYRPIIKNPSAVAYKIDYVVRLYNRNDNSQVWKTASMISYETQKYGRKIGSINLGTNPIKTIIYNKNFVKEIKINKLTETPSSTTKYITSFIDATQISVSFDTLNLDAPVEGKLSNTKRINLPSMQNSASTGNIYSNGLARILIPSSVSFLKFVIYQNNGKSAQTPLNISGIGEIILSFTSNTGEDYEFLEYPTNYTSKTRGEIVYRLNEKESLNVLGFSNRTFNLYLINEKGDKTFLYNGNFYSQNEWKDLQTTNKIVDLEKQITSLTDTKNSYLGTIQQQTNQINQLNSQNLNILNQLRGATADDAQDSQTIATLKSALDSSNDTIQTLNEQVVNLTKELSIEQSKYLKDEGLITALQAQLAEQTLLQTFISVKPTISISDGTIKGGSDSIKDPMVKPSIQYYQAAITNNQASIVSTPSEAMTPVSTPPKTTTPLPTINQTKNIGDNQSVAGSSPNPANDPLRNNTFVERSGRGGGGGISL